MMSGVIRASLLLTLCSIVLAADVSDKETLVLVDDLATEQTHSIFFAKLKGLPDHRVTVTASAASSIFSQNEGTS